MRARGARSSGMCWSMTCALAGEIAFSLGMYGPRPLISEPRENGGTDNQWRKSVSLPARHEVRHRAESHRCSIRLVGPSDAHREPAAEQRVSRLLGTQSQDGEAMQQVTDEGQKNAGTPESRPAVHSPEWAGGSERPRRSHGQRPTVWARARSTRNGFGARSRARIGAGRSEERHRGSGTACFALVDVTQP